MQQKIIGGEMEFDLMAVKRPAVNCQAMPGTYHASGRAALFAILGALSKRNVNRILLPDYLCSSIVTTVAAAGLKYDFYALNDSLLPDLVDIEAKADHGTAVMVINYFGLQNLTETVSAIRRLHVSPAVIEDDVQALFDFVSPRSVEADCSFTSLRKWLPVPDGGLARSKNNDIAQPENENGFWNIKLSGLALKGLRDSLGNIDSVYLRLLEQGEELIDASLSARGSEMTATVFERTDLPEIASARRRNAAVILSGLADMGIEPVIEPRPDSIPFFIPVVLDNRDTVRRNLFSHNIFCPIHWPLDGLKIERGAYMAAHELSIIVDHRYDVDDMKRILDVLSQSI